MVVDLLRLEGPTGGPFRSRRDEGVGDRGVGGEDRPVQVGPDDVVGASALGVVLAVVAVANPDGAEGGLSRAEHRCAGMVLEADDLTPLGVQNDAADHPGRLPARRDVEDAQAGQLDTVTGDEGVSEHLIHPADHHHRGAVGGQATQPVTDDGQVVLDPALAGVLPPTAHEQVRVLGERHTGVVVVDLDVVAVTTDPGGQASGVAQVAVDRHLERVEVDEDDPALAGVGRHTHSPSCAKPARPKRAARSLRSAIIAV